MRRYQHIVKLMRLARQVIDHSTEDIAAGRCSDDELAHMASGFEQLTRALRGTDEPVVIDGRGRD